MRSSSGANNSSEPTGKPGSRGACQSEIQWLELRLIKLDDHPAVEEVRKMAGFLRQLPIDCLTSEGLKFVAFYAPLHVVPDRRGHFYCIGGLRLFRLLKENLKDADEVLVFIHRGMSPDEIRHFAEVDVLLLPAFFGLHHNDRRLLSAAWDCTKDTKFQTGLKRKGRKALNQMLGCDIRPEKETCSTT